MKRIAIHYSPGARGSFLAKVLYDEIESTASFKSTVNNHGYKKIHHAHSVWQNVDLQNQNYYTVKISISSIRDALETAILTREKNKNFYEITKHSTYENEKTFLYNFARSAVTSKDTCSNYSFIFDYSDFKNINKLDDLYYDCNNQHLTDKHINYIQDCNKINDYFLKNQFDREIVNTVLQLLEQDLAS